MFRSRVGIDDGFDERVRRQTIAAMQTRTRTLAYGVEAFDGRLAVQIDLDTAAHIVRARCHRDILLRDIDADTQAFSVDIGKVMLGLFGVFVGHVKAHMIDGVDLHLVVYRTCHDVARREGQARVVFLHELFAVRQTKNATVTTHSLCDEISRVSLGGVVETGRVELNELHILDRTFRTIDHGDTVAGSYLGVGSGRIDRTRSSGCHEGDTTQVRINLLRLRVEDIGSVALDIGCTTCHANT